MVLCMGVGRKKRDFSVGLWVLVCAGGGQDGKNPGRWWVLVLAMERRVCE